jgi:pyridoxal/pyridoxine/pyridoxamine kinase
MVLTNIQHLINLSNLIRCNGFELNIIQLMGAKVE